MNLAFDISDIVLFAQTQRRVSGIQRVLINFLRLLSAEHDIVFADAVSGDFFSADPCIFSSPEYHAEELTAALGIERRLIPPEVKYSGRPMKKAFHSAKSWLRTPFLKMGDLDGAKPWRPRPGKTRYVALGAAFANPRLEPGLQRLTGAFDLEPVVLVHDLRALAAPEFEAMANHPLIEWFEKRSRIYKGFLTYSAFTEATLEAALSERGRQATWLRRFSLPHEFRFDDAEGSEISGLESGFVLSVGPLGYPHKNADGLIASWNDLAGELGPSRVPMLVFAGSHGKGIGRIAAAQAACPALSGKLAAVDEPTDAQLAWLYKNCSFTVFPSFYEGWGLPVGESAWMRKFCVASNRASIPEVVGEYADYFDPGDREEMVRALRRPLADPGYLEEREAKLGLMALRTWKQSAADLLSALST